MPFSAGVFTQIYSWQTDKINGIKIRADRMDGQDGDIATGLSTAILKDGTQTLTANIPFGGFKATGLAKGTARTDSVSVNQLQDNDAIYFTTGGSADAYTLTPVPAVTSYTAGQGWYVKIHTANLTSTPQINISGVGAITIANADGTAVAISDLATGGVYRIIYESSAGKFFLSNKSLTTLGLTNGGKKTANFAASANTRYLIKGNVSPAPCAALPTGGTAGDVIILAAYGQYGGQACGTINGVAQTLAFQQQTMPLTYTATIGWV